MCPFAGDTFISKDYTIMALKLGENAWQMFGAQTPPVVEYLSGNMGNGICAVAQQQGKKQMNKSESKNDTAVPEGLQRTQVMPVTGLNHGDDVKQSKKTIARLHKDCLERTKECMAKAEPQIHASHTISTRHTFYSCTICRPGILSTAVQLLL
jgi:hypothetical protein